MKMIIISEFFPPYVYGGAEVSTSLLVDSLRTEHHCTVITSQLADREWNWNGVRVIPALQRHALGDKSLVDVARYGIGSITRPLVNSFRLIKILRAEPAEIINFVASSYMLLPTIIIVSLFMKKRIIVDIRDFTTICVNDFSYPDHKEDDAPHSCFSHLNRTHSHSHSSFFMRGLLPLFDVYEVTIFQLYKFLFKRFVNRRSRVELIALSHYVKRKLIQNGFLDSKITVIPNICRIETIHISDVPLTYDFAFAGRLEMAKGIWSAIDAYQKLDMPQVKFAIAGDGTEYANIQAYITRENVPNITLLGRVAPDEVLRLYRSSKFIVAPVIRPEPFGRFIQESITTGTPVIATAVGGIPEGIIDGESGFLVTPDDILALVQAMNKAVHLPADKLQRMRNKAKQGKDKYSPATITAARMRIYGQDVN